MRTSLAKVTKFNSLIGKTVLALALVSLVGGLSTAPALADDHGRYRGERERSWQGGNDRYYERSWRNEGYRHDYRSAYRPYVYAPPPVVYAPYPWGGLSFFFDFR
jgi:hypothetical protein